MTPDSIQSSASTVGLVRKALLVLIVTLFVALAWMWLVHRPSEVDKAVQSAAEAGAFPIAGGYKYSGEVDCQSKRWRPSTDRICMSASWDSSVVMFRAGSTSTRPSERNLHTHQTDPAEIPGRVFDPGF